MVKQRGLGQSNQKELTQKGSKHKEEKQSPRAEQQAQHSKQSGVLPCRSRWLGWRRVGPAATPTAQRRCRRTGRASTSLYGARHVVSNRHVVLNWPLRRPHPSASFWGPVSSLKARTVVVGARSVTRPLTGDNCAVGAYCRELRRLSRCLPATDIRSVLSCNVRDNDTYCPASS